MSNTEISNVKKDVQKSNEKILEQMQKKLTSQTCPNSVRCVYENITFLSKSFFLKQILFTEVNNFNL